MDFFVLLFLFSMWSSGIWKAYVHWRQRHVCQTTKEVPKELKGVMDAETFEKARVFQLDKSTYAMCFELFEHVIRFTIAVYFLLPRFFWGQAGKITAFFGLGPEYEITQSVVFLVIIFLFAKSTDLPLEAYRVFVVEERHGTNKQTISFFLMDKLKQYIVATLIASLLGSGIVFLIKWGGDYFYLYTWVFIILFFLAWQFIHSDLIAPLYDRFTPLPEGELKVAIEELAASMKFPLSRLFVVEHSKRSSHSNAYISGFGKSKMIVLYDTLLPTEVFEGSQRRTSKRKSYCLNTEEVVGVLAHEIGHWKYGHITIYFTFSMLNILLLFYVFGYLMNLDVLYTTFGFTDSRPIIVGLLSVVIFFSPCRVVLMMVFFAMTRFCESQADSLAKKMHKGAALSSALVKMCHNNLGFPVLDPIFSAATRIHPSLLERMRELDAGKQD